MDTINVKPTTFASALFLAAAQAGFLVFLSLAALDVARDYVAAQRYEHIITIPKGSIVFDRRTGDVIQGPVIPMFRPGHEQEAPW